MPLPANTDDLTQYAQQQLRRCLVDLMRSHDSLARVASRSYQHDNGFIKIVLSEHETGGSALRLHVWEPHSSAFRGNIHNHCWNFESYVIAGALCYEEFVLDSEGPILATRYAYDPASTLSYQLVPKGQASLRSTRTGRHEAGLAYRLTSDTLHRTWSDPTVYTATILRQGHRKRDHADVLATDKLTSEGEDTPLTVFRLSNALTKVLSHLT